jgi:UBX domain-containing protein 1
MLIVVIVESPRLCSGGVGGDWIVLELDWTRQGKTHLGIVYLLLVSPSVSFLPSALPTSGLAVEPTPGSRAPPAGDDQDSIFNLAEQASEDDEGQVRRTITMYRDGFMVDDGPYRRLDDPANAGFLRALAMGQVPPELAQDTASGGGGGGLGGVTIGLVDKRREEYVETFRSFSGAGATLGGGTSSSSPDDALQGSTSTVDPASLPDTTPVNADQPTTSVAVRLPNGQRRVVKVNLDMTVLQLAAHVRDQMTDPTVPFRIVSGFPPKPLEDLSMTVADAGLKGAQVQIQLA